MKKIAVFIGVLFIAACIAPGCKKDNNNNPVNPSGKKSYIKMKINGKEWYDETVAVSGISVFDGKHNASVVGTNENFEGAKSGLSIIFTNTSEFSEGTYNIKDYDGGATITKVDGKTYLMTSSTAAASFTVTISEIKNSGSVKRISGTFSGTLVGPSAGDMITVTDGEFVSY